MSFSHRNSIEDVRKTLELGIKRVVPDQKIDLHFGETRPMEDLLGLLGINASFFREVISIEEFGDRSGKALDSLTRELLESSVSRRQLDMVFDYLSEEDKLEKSDWIFVFGSRNFDRPKRAGELYEAGYAKRIYCSGSRPIEELDREHEGRRFKKYLIEETKVPEPDIASDPNENSLTMTDNVRGFLNYLESTNSKIESIIMVITAHNLRRGWAIFQKYTEGLKIIRSSSGARTGVARNDWFKTPLGIKLIYEEYEKIRIQQLTNTS
jgi:hypothetical protein